jgi:hypothetical protein
VYALGEETLAPIAEKFVRLGKLWGTKKSDEAQKALANDPTQLVLLQQARAQFEAYAQYAHTYFAKGGRNLAAEDMKQGLVWEANALDEILVERTAALLEAGVSEDAFVSNDPLHVQLMTIMKDPALLEKVSRIPKDAWKQE